MLTLLNPEAHEVTSAVIVPEEGGFKIVVNKGSLQVIKFAKNVNTSMAFFRRNYALEKCKWEYIDKLKQQEKYLIEEIYMIRKVISIIDGS